MHWIYWIAGAGTGSDSASIAAGTAHRRDSLPAGALRRCRCRSSSSSSRRQGRQSAQDAGNQHEIAADTRSGDRRVPRTHDTRTGVAGSQFRQSQCHSHDVDVDIGVDDAEQGAQRQTPVGGEETGSQGRQGGSQGRQFHAAESGQART